MGQALVPEVQGNTSDTPQNIIHATYPQLIAYLVFNVWPSHVGLPVLLAIVLLSKEVKRHPTFANLCVALIIIGISFSLLLYAHAISGPEPPPVLCLLQASLIDGMSTLCSMAALMLVWQMFLRIRSAHYGKPYEDEDHMIRLWMMLISPYIAFFVPVLATATIGSHNPQRISRNRRVFYCSLEWSPLTNTIAVAAAVTLLVTIILIVWTSIILVRHQTVTRARGSPLGPSMDLQFSVRIMAFGLYLALCMSISLLSITSPSSPVPDLAVASAATVFIIIFGTQRDILRALCFWKWGRPRVVPVEEDFRAIDLRSAFDSQPPLVAEKERNYALV